MKAKHLFIASLSLFILGSCSAGRVVAQNNIDRLVSEMEKEGNISENTVIKRNRTTKKTYKEVKSISFYTKNDDIKKFQNAFNKDSEQAISVIRNGRLSGKNSMTLIFEEGKKKSIYTLNIYSANSKPYLYISIINYDAANKDKDDDDDDSSYIINGVPMDQWKKSFQTYNDFDWKPFNEKMKNLSKNLSEKLKDLPNTND